MWRHLSLQSHLCPFNTFKCNLLVTCEGEEKNQCSNLDIFLQHPHPIWGKGGGGMGCTDKTRGLTLKMKEIRTIQRQISVQNCQLTLCAWEQQPHLSVSILDVIRAALTVTCHVTEFYALFISFLLWFPFPFQTTQLSSITCTDSHQTKSGKEFKMIMFQFCGNMQPQR